MRTKLVVIETVVVIILVLTSAYLILIRENDLGGGTNWHPAIKKYSNGFGTIRIGDTESNTTLFTYDIDAEVHPVSVEKMSNGQWRVTLESRSNKLANPSASMAIP